MAGINPLYSAIILTVISTILYHLIQKATPVDVNPIISLFITYITAAAFCVILYPFFGKGLTLSEQLHKINWATFALGAAVLGIEVGYLFAYRAGGNLSTTNLLASTLVSVTLLLIGYLYYLDHITPYKIVGILLCILGIFFINK